MVSFRNAFKRLGGLVGLIFIATSCVGLGQSDLLPTPTPAATATSEPEPVQPTHTAVANESVNDQATPRPTRFPADKYADLEIVTLLPRDAIPAIDDPRFLTAADADDFYDADELVMGVTFDGDSRAYSVPFLSNHEIVNDTVGGVKIAVTW